MNKPSRYKRLLGEHNASISIQTYLIYSPISVLAVPASLADQVNLDNILEAITIGVITTLGIGCLLFVSNLAFELINKNLSSISNELIKFINIIICGASRGILMYYLIEISNFRQPNEIQIRVLSSTANFLFWIIVIERVIEESRKFGKRYRALISASILKIANNATSGTGGGNTANWGQEIDDIRNLLSKTIEGVDLDNLRAEKLVSAAITLRNIIEQRVRPLSHRLWASSTDSVPRIQYRAILSASFRYPVIPALPLAISISVISAVNLTSTFGFERGMISALFLFANFFVYFRFIHRRVLDMKRITIAKGFLSIIYPAIFANLISYLVNTFYFEEHYGLFNLLVAANCSAITIAFAIYEVNKMDRNNILIEIERGVADLLKRQELSRNAQDEQIASYLHNALQPEILALSLQLEEAAQKVDVTETREIMERVASKLNRSLYEELPGSDVNVLERLGRIQSAWKGLVDVQLDLSEEFLEAIQQNFLVTQIVDEAIANSVRHQNAKKVFIKGSRNERNQIHLSVISKGLSKPANSAGLGSEWLDRYFRNRWERRVNGDEVVLEIEL